VLVWAPPPPPPPRAPTPDSRMWSVMRRVRFVAVVLLASIIAIEISQGVEIFVNRVLRPDADA
jgi:hypothetical protein